MIWWHQVGQKVVCVSLSGKGYGWEQVPKVGETYTVRAVRHGPGFLLEEIRNTSAAYTWLGTDVVEVSEICFLTTHFRPVRDTSIESLRELLNPTPEAKRAVFQEMIEERQKELLEKIARYSIL